LLPKWSGQKLQMTLKTLGYFESGFFTTSFFLNNTPLADKNGKI